MSSLQDRIELAIERITSGHAPMRVPVDETDPDMVLRDCQMRIAELEAERDRLRKDADRYRAIKSMRWAELEQIKNHTSRAIRHGGMTLDEAVDATLAALEGK